MLRVGDPLPNHGQAVIESRKLVEFVFSPANDVGRHHARVFRSALGYDRATSMQFRREIISKLAAATVSKVGGKPEFPTFEVKLPLKGPNGKTKMVVTAWFIEDDGRPRLVTAYVEDPQPPEYAD